MHVNGGLGSFLNDLSESQLGFVWNSSYTSFGYGTEDQLSIGWVNQANDPVYTELNITSPRQGITEIPPNLNGAVFAAITCHRANKRGRSQPYNNLYQYECAFRVTRLPAVWIILDMSFQERKRVREADEKEVSSFRSSHPCR
jgi:hypothetical protein